MRSELAKKYLEKTRLGYNMIAKEFSDTRYRPWPEMEQLVAKYVRHGDSVLDVGCGNGRLFQLLKDRGVQYLGMDNSVELIKKAKEKFPKAEFLMADGLDLSLIGQQKFDCVFLLAVLHHIPSREYQIQVLRQIYEHLRPGGTLIMENWNLHQERFWIQWFATRFRDFRLGWRDLLIPWKKFNDPLLKGKIIWRFCHVFSLKELGQLLKASGFEVCEQYYVKKGLKSSIWQGHNLVSVGKKY